MKSRYACLDQKRPANREPKWILLKQRKPRMTSYRRQNNWRNDSLTYGAYHKAKGELN